MPLVHLLNKKVSSINSNGRTLITINNGVDKITRLYGSIIIKVNKKYKNKLEQCCCGVATLLEGGMVYIDDIKDENYFNPSILSNEKYVKVKDISTELN